MTRQGWRIGLLGLATATLLHSGPVRADQWGTLGISQCVRVAPGAVTDLYNTPRLMRQEVIGTLPPGDLYRIAGVSTRYRLLRATAHTPGYRPGALVGWVWSIRLRQAPAAACQ